MAMKLLIIMEKLLFINNCGYSCINNKYFKKVSHYGGGHWGGKNSIVLLL